MSATPPQPQAQYAFRRFLLCDTLTLLAMMVGQVAISWWIAVENGAHDLALYATTSAAVACVAIPIMSTVGDRYNKRSLIQLGMVVYTLSGVAMAWVASLGGYDIRIILVVQAVAISGVSLVESIGGVIAADILPAALLPQGLQRQKLWQSLGQLSGPIIGGAALAYGGVIFALWVQVLLLAPALTLIRRLPDCPVAAQGNVRHSWLVDLAAGARAKWRIKLERNWTLISFLVGVSLVPSLGMLVPLKVRALQLSGEWLGLCEAAVALGVLLGATVGVNTRLVARFGRYRLRFGATTLLGPALVLVGFSSTAILLVTSLMLAGATNSMVLMMGYTRRILATPHRFRTRVTAVNILLAQLSAVVGPAAAGVMLLRSSITSVYLILGSSLLICSFGWVLTPDFRRFMSLDDHEVEGWYGVCYPEAFESETHV